MLKAARSYESIKSQEAEVIGTGRPAGRLMPLRKDNAKLQRETNAPVELLRPRMRDAAGPPAETRRKLVKAKGYWEARRDVGQSDDVIGDPRRSRWDGSRDAVCPMKIDWSRPRNSGGDGVKWTACRLL